MASKPTRNQVIRPYISEICDRLCPIADYLNDRWLGFCARNVDFGIVSLVPRSAGSLSNHGYYKKFPNVHYYDIKTRGNDDDEEILGAIEYSSGKLRKAAMTFCMCDHAVYAVWRYLERVLRRIPGFVKMESKRERVVPRIILFREDDIPGEETVFEHNYIVIAFRHGFRFVLDLTGYQFGFERVLYTLEEYQRIVLKRKEDGVVVDVEREMRQEWHKAMDSCFDDKGNKLEVKGHERAVASACLQFALEL